LRRRGKQTREIGGTANAPILAPSGIVKGASLPAGCLLNQQAAGETPAQGLGDFHAPGDVPNATVIVRGGQSEMPAPGTTFSGSQGTTTAEAAAGVPHGQIRESTAGDIRAGGGNVEVKPEQTRSGTLNPKHVDVTEGKPTFGPVKPNPVPKKDRIE
jgi:hypothetical protein